MYGLPSKVQPIYHDVVNEMTDPEQEETERNNKKIVKRANLGIILLLIGFSVQFISAWFTSPLYTSNKKLTQFQIYTSDFNSTITLYSDSTFQEVKNQQGTINNYYGSWHGSIAKDSTITTTATRINLVPITLLPTSTYCFTNNNVVLINSRVK